MCQVYRIFCKDWEHLYKFSDHDMLEMYNSETYGDPVSSSNGFLVGKKWLSVTVAMWKEDIRGGILFKEELYKDGKYPQWWLDSVLKHSKPA
jgi:hypothetical protein